MTGAQIISAVRVLLQDDQYPEDAIIQAANWFVYELCNNNSLRIMEESTTLEAALADTTLDYPEDLARWVSFYATAPRTYELTDNFVEYKEFMRTYASFATNRAAAVGIFTDYNNAFRFSQPLLTNTTFQLDYVRDPEPMINAGSECEIPSRYIELVCKGTKVRIMEIDEDYAEAAQERNLLAPLMTTFIRNEARGGGKTKPTVIGNGKRRGYAGRRNSYLLGE